MSATPRTDAAIEEVDVAYVSFEGLASSPRKVVDVEFARELERENAELALVVRKMLLHFPAALNGITTEEELRAAIDAAREAKP